MLSRAYGASTIDFFVTYLSYGRQRSADCHITFNWNTEILIVGMSRGVGEVDLVSQLPEAAVSVAGLVTQVGDMWFVGGGVLFVYALSYSKYSITETPLQDSLYLFALVIGAYAFTVVLKQTFGLPRPPDAGTAASPAFLPAMAHGIYESMVTGDGYGFPSGHALKTTVVYGGAALTLTTWKRSEQLLSVGVVAGLVAASRVVLGVHYVVDVVVGLVLGGIFLVTVDRLTDRDPQRALLVSLAVGLVAFGMTVGYKAGLVVVLSLVSIFVWRWRDARVSVPVGIGKGNPRR